jgi:hypothetical protein
LVEHIDFWADFAGLPMGMTVFEAVYGTSASAIVKVNGIARQNLEGHAGRMSFTLFGHDQGG